MGRRSQAKQHKNDIKPKETCSSKLQPNQRKLQPLVDKLLRLTTSPPEQNTSKNIELQKEINELIDQVQTLEKCIEWKCSVDTRSSAAILERFLKWMHENGGTFDNVAIAKYPGYELGLQAEKDIGEACLITAVPRELMLTVEAANRSQLKTLIERDPLLSNMPNVALSLFLLLEKFEGNSFWKPYIDILPTIYSTVLYFNVEELKELQGSPTLDSALKQIKNIIRQYAYFYKIIWTSDDPVCKTLRTHFSFQEYRWAVSTIMTRQNTIPSEDGTHFINALIPLWDLCNHTNGHITTHYNSELNRIECLAVKNFKIGDQLFIFYGARSNAELFIHNGFVLEDNEHDGYWLRLGMSKSDALKGKRQELLAKLSMNGQGEFCLKKCEEPVNGQLLAYLRVFNMDEGQLEFWLENEKINDLKSIKCGDLEESFKNKYWNFLLTRLKLILRSYKTTLEEDVVLTEDHQLSKNKLLAIQMRISEKKILKFTLNYVESCLKN